MPDIVTVAKAMGNGHPLGAVITTRAIADAFAAQGYFFSPRAAARSVCVVGMAVLDVLERRGAAGERARASATTCRTRLEALADAAPAHRRRARHAASTSASSSSATARRSSRRPRRPHAICERLLELGVIMQPTGDHMNVLKIKPPLCLTEAAPTSSSTRSTAC